MINIMYENTMKGFEHFALEKTSPYAETRTLKFLANLDPTPKKDGFGGQVKTLKTVGPTERCLILI